MELAFEGLDGRRHDDGGWKIVPWSDDPEGETELPRVNTSAGFKQLQRVASSALIVGKMEQAAKVVVDQVVEELIREDKISSPPTGLQGLEPEPPQTFMVREARQSTDHAGGSALDTLQKISVAAEVRRPGLTRILEPWTDEAAVDK